MTTATTSSMGAEAIAPPIGDSEEAVLASTSTTATATATAAMRGQLPHHSSAVPLLPPIESATSSTAFGAVLTPTSSQTSLSPPPSPSPMSLPSPPSPPTTRRQQHHFGSAGGRRVPAPVRVGDSAGPKLSRATDDQHHGRRHGSASLGGFPARQPSAPGARRGAPSRTTRPSSTVSIASSTTPGSEKRWQPTAVRRRQSMLTRRASVAGGLVSSLSSLSIGNKGQALDSLYDEGEGAAMDMDMDEERDAFGSRQSSGHFAHRRGSMAQSQPFTQRHGYPTARARLRRRASCPTLFSTMASAPPSTTQRINSGAHDGGDGGDGGAPSTRRRPRRRSSLFPSLPGVPAQVAALSRIADASPSPSSPSSSSSSLPSQSQYERCWNHKPLHDRGERRSGRPRRPVEKVVRVVERKHSNVRVIRVGGGYIILTEEMERYLAEQNLRRLMDGQDLNDLGLSIKKRRPDGTYELEDGSVVLPDGTRVFENGMRLRADGTWVDADGNEITDEDTLARLNKLHGTGPFRPGTNQSRRSGSSRPASRNAFGGGSLDAEARDTFPTGTDGDAATNGSGAGGRGRADKMSTRSDAEEDSGGESRPSKSRLHSRKLSWDFSSEVTQVLEDGTKVLADGTRINPDGSITLADGTVLSKEEAIEFARKRKLGRWPKPLSKKKGGGGSDDGDGDDDGRGGRRSRSKDSSPGGSRRHSRQHSIDGVHGTKIGLDDDDGATSQTKGARRRHMRRFPAHDPYGYESAGDVASHLRRGNTVNALDYLSRYCIITQEQLKHYRTVFDNLDRDHDGIISHVELEFGVKTVNKNVITSRELEYVNVVLELQLAREINFRMFALISALSERVVGLDLFVRGLVNQMDSKALARKIIGCKDLFYILDEKRRGAVDVDDLSNELIAGRISQEHENIIIDKFTEDGKEEVDFLDFLTYIPLFVEIHDTINSNPFETLRNK